jgi:DNA-binding NarL/FixJ family response regulator
MMQTYHRILIKAKPGHFRDSLEAVLRTLPRTELFLAGSECDDWEGGSQLPHTIVVADLESAGSIVPACLSAFKVSYPSIHCVILVDNNQQTKAAYLMGADLVLPRSASAGELLSAIQRMQASNGGGSRYHQSFPYPAIS